MKDRIVHIATSIIVFILDIMTAAIMIAVIVLILGLVYVVMFRPDLSAQITCQITQASEVVVKTAFTGNVIYECR